MAKLDYVVTNRGIALTISTVMEVVEGTCDKAIDDFRDMFQVSLDDPEDLPSDQIAARHTLITAADIKDALMERLTEVEDRLETREQAKVEEKV